MVFRNDNSTLAGDKMTSHVVTERVTWKCPFCDGQATAGYLDGEDPVVLHTTPTCSKFDDLDLPEYIAACRKKMAG